MKHFKPLSLLIVLASVYGFLTYYYGINIISSNIQISAEDENYASVKATIDKTTTWVKQHYSLVALMQLPIFALGTYLGFKKAGYNFIEHLVVHSFLTSQRLLLCLFAFPILYLFNKTPSLGAAITVVDLVGYSVMARSLFQLFHTLGTRQRIWRIFLSLAISFFIFLIVMLAITAYFASRLG